jgi:gamma-glutamyl-gamma-aminobutyrate hydrolase PuuD
MEEAKKGVSTIKHWTKQTSNVESHEVNVEGHRIRFRIINYSKERDGIRIPHLHKQIFCSPAAPIELLRNNSKDLWETVGGYD